MRTFPVNVPAIFALPEFVEVLNWIFLQKMYNVFFFHRQQTSIAHHTPWKGMKLIFQVKVFNHMFQLLQWIFICYVKENDLFVFIERNISWQKNSVFFVTEMQKVQGGVIIFVSCVKTQ